MRIPIIILIASLLGGCSALDVATKAAGGVLGTQESGLSIDTELQNGDKTINTGENDNSETNIDDNEGQISIQSKKSDKAFENIGQVNVQEGPNPWYLLLLALGWLLPSHTEIYREIKSWFRPKI